MSSRRKLSEDIHDDCTVPKKSRPSLENTPEDLEAAGNAAGELVDVHVAPKCSRTTVAIHDLHENILVEILQHLDIVKQLDLQRYC